MTYLQNTICAHCGARHELASAVADKGDVTREPRPSDGDITLCIACGRFNIFDDGSEGGLRQPTEAEQRELKRNRNARMAAEAWAQIKPRKY